MAGVSVCALVTILSIMCLCVAIQQVEGAVSDKPEEGVTSDKPEEGVASDKPEEGVGSDKPKEGYVSKDEGTNVQSGNDTEKAVHDNDKCEVPVDTPAIKDNI